MTEQILILDFGSQYTQVIARRIRECHVYSTIVRFDMPAREIAALKPKGLILSGGPSSVYSPNAPLPDPAIFKLGIPVLGICYGVQLMAQFLGGKVERGLKREYGKGTLVVTDSHCALFANLPDSLQVWNSHGDKLAAIPKGFKAVGHVGQFGVCGHRGSVAEIFRAAISSGSGAYAARAGNHCQFRPQAFAGAAANGPCAITSTRPSRRFASGRARNESSSV